MNEKMRIKLENHLQKPISVDFKTGGGIIGNSVEGILTDIMDDFVELHNCTPGHDVQLVNIHQATKIEIINDEDDDE